MTEDRLQRLEARTAGPALSPSTMDLWLVLLAGLQAFGKHPPWWVWIAIAIEAVLSIWRAYNRHRWR